MHQNGNGWTALCPSHDDHSPSLAISEDNNGTVGIYCHAGCESSDILATIGLTFKDLFPSNGLNGKKPAKRVWREQDFVAKYDYIDEKGALLFQVCRTPDKDFPQRRPDGRGGWIWNMKGVRRVLYRLPEVLEAIRKSEIIYLLEGEKDADNLHRAGLTATTNSGGAKAKWINDYTSTLTGANIIIIPDNELFLSIEKGTI